MLMKQLEVLDYVLANDCYLYEQRVKEDGIYYYVRRNNTRKLVVIYPVQDNDDYSIPAICHICEVMCIDSPADISPYCKAVQAAKEKAKSLDQYPQPTMN